MNPVRILREEHEKIGVELDELDFIMGDSGCPYSSFESSEEGEINYPNLVHTFWKLCEIWENHEKMEEELFGVMKREGFEIPIEGILLEHEDLRGHVKKIGDAINSGSDIKVRKALCKDVKVFVDVLRKHTGDEESILSGVIVGDFSEDGMREMKEIVGKYR